MRIAPENKSEIKNVFGQTRRRKFAIINLACVFFKVKEMIPDE